MSNILHNVQTAVQTALVWIGFAINWLIKDKKAVARFQVLQMPSYSGFKVTEETLQRHGLPAGVELPFGGIEVTLDKKGYSIEVPVEIKLRRPRVSLPPALPEWTRYWGPEQFAQDIFLGWVEQFEEAGPVGTAALLADIVGGKVEAETPEVLVFKARRKPYAINLATGTITAQNTSFHVTDKVAVETGKGFEICNGRAVLAACLAVLSTLKPLGAMSPGAVDAKLSKGLASLWREIKPYGAALQSDDILQCLLNHSCKSIRITAPILVNKRAKLPLNIVESPFDASLMGSLADIDVASFCDKQAIKGALHGAAFDALMLWHKPVKKGGVTEKYVYSVHDLSKATKAVARPTQAFRSQFADIVGGLVPANLKTMTSDGPVVFRGVPVKAALTNSRFGSGSGVSFARPGFRVDYYVNKPQSGQIDINQLPAAVVETLRRKMLRGDENFLAGLVPLIQKKLERTLPAGTRVKSGDVLLSIFEGPAETIVVKAGGYNCEYVTTGTFEVSCSQVAEVLYVKIGANLVGSDANVKWRGAGIKATCFERNFDLSVDGETVEVDVLFPYETRKGHPASMYMYAQSKGVGTFEQGVITFDSGEVVDLSDPESDFYRYTSAAAARTSLVRRTVSRSHFDYVQGLCNGYADDLSDIVMSDVEVTFTEKVEALVGELVLQVEVSLPREAGSKQALTGETLAAIEVINPSLAAQMWTDGEYARQGMLTQLTMVGKTGREPEINAPVVDLGYDVRLSNELWAMANPVSGEVISGRSLLKLYAKKFPKGVIFSASSSSGLTEDHEVYISFEALLAGGNFRGDTCSGIALDVVSFLKSRTYSGLKPDYYDSNASCVIARLGYKFRKAFCDWNAGGEMTGLLGAKSTMKRAVRAARNASVCKVHTSDEVWVQPTPTGIPVVVLNPEDMLAANVVNDGYVFVARTPMIFGVVAKVRMDAAAPIGFLTIAAETWAQATEGDGDGDPCLYIAVQVTEEEVLAFNSHILSLAGYNALYGDKIPFADFCSPADKAKKSIKVQPNKAAGGKAIIVSSLPFSELVGTAISIGDHYRKAVGTAYGMASSAISLLAVAAATARRKGEELPEAKLLGCVYAWRLVYEGLGLAGYTPAAHDFFEVLRENVGNPDATTRGAAIAASLKEYDVPSTVAPELLDLYATFVGYRRLVKPGMLGEMLNGEQESAPWYVSDRFYNRALVAGSFRMAMQGAQNPGSEEFDGETDVHLLEEAVKLFVKADGSLGTSSLIVGDTVNLAYKAYSLAAAAFADVLAAEELGDDY